MKVSTKTKDLISELEKFSGSTLKNITELEYLTELAETSRKEKLFFDIQFTAKYLNGLGKILKTGVIAAANKNGNGQTASRRPDSLSGQGKPPASEEAGEKIMKEYKDNIIKLQNYLKDLLLDADENVKTEFENKYLSLSRASLVNLTTLIYDLTWLKKYYNSKRV